MQSWKVLVVKTKACERAVWSYSSTCTILFPKPNTKPKERWRVGMRTWAKLRSANVRLGRRASSTFFSRRSTRIKIFKKVKSLASTWKVAVPLCWSQEQEAATTMRRHRTNPFISAPCKDSWHTALPCQAWTETKLRRTNDLSWVKFKMEWCSPQSLSSVQPSDTIY